MEWEPRLLGPKPPLTFEGDGCTMSPDSWKRWGGRHVDFYEACRFHDWAYRQACSPNILRVTADLYFACNMIELGAPRYLAFWYFLVVRCVGWRFWKKQ